MPTLEWIGKGKVVNYRPEVHYWVSDERYTYNAEQSKSRIIRSNNLRARKTLRPRYE